MLCTCSLPRDVNLFNSRGCSSINCCHTPLVFSHRWTPKLDAFHLAFGWTHQPCWHRAILITAGQFYGKLFQRPREKSHINGWSPFSLNKSLLIGLNSKPPCPNLFLLSLHLLINSNIKSISCSLHFLLKLDRAQVLVFKGILCLRQLEQSFHLPGTESGSCLGRRHQPGSLPSTHCMLSNESNNPKNLFIGIKEHKVPCSTL